MATSGNTVELVFRSVDHASAGINRIAQNAQGMGRTLEAGPLGAIRNLTSAFGGLAGIAGVGAAVAGFKKLVDAGVDVQETVQNLRGAVEGVGGNFRKLGGDLENTIQQIHRASRFDDEEIRRGLTSIIQLTGDLEQSEKSLGVIADFAAARHLGFAQAAEMVAKAGAGMGMTLRREGVVFTELEQKALQFGTAAERLQITMGRLNAQFGGGAQRDLGTYAGQLAHMRQQAGDLADTIGTRLVTAMADFAVRAEQFRRQMAQIRAERAGQGMVSRLFGVVDWTEAIVAQPSEMTATDAANNAAIAGMRLRRENAQLIEEEKKRNDELVQSILARHAAEVAAAKATQGWQSDAQQLAESMKDLSLNVADVTRRTGDSGAGIAAYSDEILRLAADADRLGVTFPAAFKKMVAAAEELRAAGLPQLPQGMTLEQFQRFTTGQTASPVLNVSGLNAATDRIMAGIAADLKRAAEEAGRVFVEHFQRPMTDIFTDLALTGGANFGRIAGQMFEQAVRRGAEGFVGLLTQGIDSLFPGGGAVTGSPGAYFINGESVSDADAGAALGRQARWGQALGAGVGGVQAFSMAQRTGTQRQSALSQVASHTMTGAGIGAAIGGGVFSWATAGVGALVGAVVGAVSALLAPPQGADYSYGRFGVRGGQAFFDYSPRGGSGETGQLQNISANAARTARAQIESAFGDTYGDFVRTLLRFPMEVLPATFAAIGDVLPDIGKEAGGDIGRAASANFWKDFELWFRQGMPRDIADRFRPVFEQAFTGMGFTIERFNEIWTSLQDLDPAEARQLLDQWAQAATELPEAFAFLRQPFGGRGGGLDWAQREMRRSPADRLTEAYDPILRLANTLGNLPIAEQIRGWAEVNRQIQEVQQNFRDLLLEIAEGIRSVTESYGSSIRELEIAGIRTPEGEPDYQGQAEYLRRYANDLRARIGSAASPAEALALGEELRGTLMQIYQLGQQLGPEAGEQFRLWALGALEEGRDAVIESLRVIGEEAAAANQAFLDSIQTPWLEFTGAAAESTRDFTAALVAATSAIKNLLRGGGDGGDGGPKPLPEIQPIAPKDEGGAFFAGSGFLERLERIERAIGENAARSTKILAEAAYGTTAAVREGKEITVPVTIVQEASGPTTSAGPSSRRGR